MLIYLSLLDSREDKNKFTQLYNTYRYTMLYTADNILQDKGLAEDAVHDAFLRIAKNLHKTGAVDSPRTKAFVVIIVRNIALTMAKQRGRSVLFEDEKMIDSVADNTNDRDFDRMNYEDMLAAVRNLPVTYRDVLYLNVVEGYSTKEISQILEISVEAVKKRLQRGRRLLIETLQKEGLV